jgi:hypothetical protein
MDPKEVTRAFPPLAKALASEEDAYSRKVLVQILSEAAARMPPGEAAAPLAGALAKEGDPFARRALAEGLSEAAARMPPGEAARACAGAFVGPGLCPRVARQSRVHQGARCCGSPVASSPDAPSGRSPWRSRSSRRGEHGRLIEPACYDDAGEAGGRGAGVGGKSALVQLLPGRR